MYGIFTYIYHKNQPNVGKYTIHGWYGICKHTIVRLVHKTFLEFSVGDTVFRLHRDFNSFEEDNNDTTAFRDVFVGS